MNRELMQILEQVAREKGLPLKVIVEAMVTAIELAARKRDKAKFDVEYDESTGTIRLYAIKEVVETVTNSRLEIDLQQARKIRPRAVIGDEIYIERDISDLGRISAQKAKQIINQKVKEAEKQKVFDLYKDRIGDVVLGTVQRVDNGVVVNLGEAEAILPRREQIPGEFYKRGDKIRAFITDVRMGSSGKWPQIVLSRTCDDFLIRLFEIEVPEIAEGIVQIVGVAREPGVRAKIGVRSIDRNVDPVGACVGMRGARIQSIVRELRGEKIDIIEWSDDPAVLVSRAITPAKVQGASVNRDEKIVDAVVADDQLALAIGKRGQNAKLAVRLTKWRINITSESERKIAVQESFDRALAQAGFGEPTPDNEEVQLFSPVQEEQTQEQDEHQSDLELEQTEHQPEFEPEQEESELESEHEESEPESEHEEPELESEQDESEREPEDSVEEELEEELEEDEHYHQSDLSLLPGMDEMTIDHLNDSGFFSIEDIASSSIYELASVPGIDDNSAQRLLELARQFLETPDDELENVHVPNS
jgi:N utilization substance protein A